MSDDDLSAYEAELAEGGSPRPRSNRGFWLVLGTILLACVVLVVEIFANKPIKDSIAHAEASLRTAQSAAEEIHAATGSFNGADAAGMTQEAPSLTYLGPDESSQGLDEVSVVAAPTGWAAAVQARPDACFYLRLTDAGEVFYGVGTTCTGAQATYAADPRW